MQSYTVSANSKAGAATLYGALLDGPSWPIWMRVDRVTTARLDANATQDTVGDVREVRTGKYVNHEKIVELVPNRTFRYVILDGILLDYRGEVTLLPALAGGTQIRWHASFRMKIPGAAWLMKFYMTRYMQRAVSGLARYAEHLEENSACGTVPFRS